MLSRGKEPEALALQWLILNELRRGTGRWNVLRLRRNPNANALERDTNDDAPQTDPTENIPPSFEFDYFMVRHLGIYKGYANAPSPISARQYVEEKQDDAYQI
jgi:hypothetical protein